MDRRVIYMDDETWDGLRMRAATEGKSISAVIRDLALGTEKVRPVDAVVAPPTPKPVVTHVSPEARYDARPIRPVPKKVK